MAKLPVRTHDENVVAINKLLGVIEIGVESYEQGRQEGYLIVACPLYVLLCDKTRKTPLLMREFPDIELHPIHGKDPKDFSDDGLKPEDRVYFKMFDRMKKHFDMGKITFELFDMMGKKLRVDKWLQQSLGVYDGEIVSIEKFVKSIRDQEGAGHFDPEPDKTTEAIGSPHATVGGQIYPNTEVATILIGKEVWQSIRSALDKLPARDSS